MKDFFSHCRREIRRLKRDAEILDQEGKEDESMAILCIVEEIELAVGIVQQSIATAKKLRSIASLE